MFGSPISASFATSPLPSDRLAAQGAARLAQKRGSTVVKGVLAFLALGLVLQSAARAQIATDFTPPRAGCCLPDTAQSLADQLQDWNQLGRYHAANEQLKEAAGRPEAASSSWATRSPTAGGWPTPFRASRTSTAASAARPTAQMLVRMYPGRHRAEAGSGGHARRHQRHRAQQRPADARDDRAEHHGDDRAGAGARHQGDPVRAQPISDKQSSTGRRPTS